MTAELVQKLLSSIKIVNMQFYLDSILAKPAQNFIDYIVTDTMPNPVDIGWPLPNIIPINTIDSMVVLVSFESNAPNLSFNMALIDVHAWDVDPDLPFSVVDRDGNSLNKSNLMYSPTASSVPDNPEEAFITFPNPFGQLQEYANIRLLLENESDVEIYIFTLVGELVWTRIVRGESRGLHNGLYDEKYRWDGRNDRGNRVLNGVYLCVLKAEGKTFITKVAYIK
jgi:hypothetical protein